MPNNSLPIDRKNQNSVVKWIILPLSGFILIVIISAVFLLSQISTGKQPMLNWLNISIIIVSLLLFIPGLFFLVIVFGLIIVINKSRQPLLSGLEKTQQYIFKASNFIISIVNIILKPIIFVESLLFFFRKLKT
jgi:hypothetical protein